MLLSVFSGLSGWVLGCFRGCFLVLGLVGVLFASCFGWFVGSFTVCLKSFVSCFLCVAIVFIRV